MKKSSIRFLILLMTVVMICSMNFFAFAGAENGNNQLTVSEVIQNVNEQIDSYVESDIQGKGRGIYADESILPFYDLDDTIVAYMVPLYDEDNKEVGYMITSAYKDGPIMCELSLDNALVSDFNKILKEDQKLTYLFLMQYGIETDKANEYYDINPNNIESLASNNDINFSENNDAGSNSYDGLTKTIEINRQDTEKFNDCLKFSTSSYDASSMRNAVASNINLDTVDENFWSLITPVDTYYGGDQNWWDDWRSYFGCGTVAAANIAAYYDRYHGLTSLYAPSTRTKSKFITHMDNVELYVGSEVGGIATIDELASEFEDYAVFFGDDPINAHWNDENENYDEDLEGYSSYVIDGLSNEYPVAYLQWFGEYDDFNNHWMTITKYFQNSSGRWIAISSWAERYSLDFELVCENFGGGLIYFDID